MPLRVLEIGNAHCAGFAGKLLKRWGADVVRVETGEDTALSPTEAHAVDLYLHVDKRRVGLDLQQPEGRTLLREIASQCDVLIADLAPAELDLVDWRQLGGARLRARVTITPFGISGPYRDWLGTSSVLLAMGGQTYIMGDPDRAPLTMPGRYLQYQAGQYAYVATLAALRGSPRPSEDASEIDVSVLETALSLSQFTTVMWTFGERIRERHGNDFGALHPITLYPCADGWFAVNVTPDFWPEFTRVLGRPELVDDARFATTPARGEHSAELDAIVHQQLGGKTREEILELGQRVFRVPTGILKSPAELLEDEHLRARAFWQSVHHGDRSYEMPGSPFRYVGERTASPHEQLPRHELHPISPGGQGGESQQEPAGT